jgi:hypothetical protein
MKVLVACEESQRVVKEFRKRGHEAYSCDLAPCSGDHPEWHLQQDVIPLLSQPWDLVIAFPPCTHLASSGARWFKEKLEKTKRDAVQFFLQFTKIPGRWAIENPVGVMSTKYRKPDQIIHPWQFGHKEAKATCLWLHGLPKLKSTKIMFSRKNKVHRMVPSPDRSILRSKTYIGIARAMAEQWGNSW